MPKFAHAIYTDNPPASTTIKSGQVGNTTSTVSPSGYYAAISITGTKLKSVKVPLAHEGLLKKLTVKEKSGSSVAFVVELLTSSLPFPAGEQATTAITTPAATIDLYRVCPQQTATAGNVVDLTPEYDVGYAFKNADGDYTNNQRYLYLVISPTAAAGTTVWEALILVETTGTFA